MKTDTETDINLVSVPLFKDKFLDWEGLIGRGLKGDLEKFSICFDICDTENVKILRKWPLQNYRYQVRYQPVSRYQNRY